MAEETLLSGGMVYEAGWLMCKAAASFKRGEAVVRVDAADPKQLLGFFVDSDLVQPSDLPKTEVDGKVKVIVVERNGGTSRVSVPGEPFSFGPQIVVQNDLFV